MLRTFGSVDDVDFYRAMQCIRGTSQGPVSVSVCLSICLCVTSRSSTKTAKHRITQTTPPRDSSFLMPKISAKFDRRHPYERAEFRLGGSKSATFDK